MMMLKRFSVSVSYTHLDVYKRQGTSGLVIVAKTPEAEELFLAAIKNREVKKTYLCVTCGRPMPPDATLGGYLLKDADRGIVKIV